MSIKHINELDLQEKIRLKLNAQGYHFEIGTAVDLVDAVNQIYIEVKSGKRLAAAQVLYAVAVGGLSPTLLGVANEFELRLYRPPRPEEMQRWARTVSPITALAPSAVKATFDDSAFKVLGDPVSIYNFVGDFDPTNGFAYINATNYEIFTALFDRYWLEPGPFIRFVAHVTESGGELHVNPHGRILDTVAGEFYANESLEYLPRPVRSVQDQQLIRRTRVRLVDLPHIAERIDVLSPMALRRKRGKFFTRDALAEDVSAVLAQMLPECMDFVLEPYVGSGNMLRPLLDRGIRFVVNDIDAASVAAVRERWGTGPNGEDFAANVHNADFILTPTEAILRWLPADLAHLLVFTNPPFGASRANHLSSRQRDGLKATGSRERHIIVEYGGLGDTYGRGDLVIPAIAKMVEVVKARGEGVLAFFSPLGVLAGRHRYNKLLAALLANFRFVYGSIHSGEEFGDVARGKPIAFSVWRYEPGDHGFEDMAFDYLGRTVSFRQLPLLKAFWRYNTAEPGDALSVQHCDCFNTPPAKMFSPYATSGGSHVKPENVKAGPEDILGVPADLVYALWSTTVGNRSICGSRLPFDNCYTHLPDFGHPRLPEILGLVALTNIAVEKRSDYTHGMIAYDCSTKAIKFGNPRLAAGVRVLLGHVPAEWFDRLQESERAGNYDALLAAVRARVRDLVGQIGYWDYLPFGGDA